MQASARSREVRTRDALAIGAAAMVSAVVLWVAMRLGAVLILADWSPHICRWDCGWFTYIVEEGYDRTPRAGSAGQANYAFFPAFPLLGWAVHKLVGIAPRDALVLTSRLLYFLAALAFYAYLSRRLGRTPALFGALLLHVSPFAIYGHAGYSEPLYFLLSTLGYWALHEGRWLGAGAVGALLSATRPNGVLFGIVIAVAGLRRVRELTAEPKMIALCLVALALVPAGLALFMLHLYDRTGDPLAFAQIQSAWGRRLSNPGPTLLTGLLSSDRRLYFAVAAIVGLSMAGYLALKRYVEESAGLVINILVPLSAGGLDALPRFIGWQLPFLFGLVVLIGSASRAVRGAALAVSGVLAALMAFAWGSLLDFVV